MNKVYIIEKKYLKTLYLIEEDIILEEISDSYSLYNNIVKIYSNDKLNLEESELYRPFRIIASDKDFKKDARKMQCNYIENITKFKNITSVVEKKNNNNYIVFYSNSLPLYIKNFDKKRLLTHLNSFKENDKYYGKGKTTEVKLRTAGNNFKSLSEIHYGQEDIDKETKKDINKKDITSDCDLNKYLNIKEKDGYYQYNDLEDIKNILRVENNLLPTHKLLKTDKFMLLDINNETGLFNNIKDHNESLANNELVYSDNDMLKDKSKLFYSQAQKHHKSIFSDQEEAVCCFLSFKLNGKEAIMVSEKDQWIVFHKDKVDTLNETDCREKLLTILKNKSIDIENLTTLTLKQLANLFIHNNELILSDADNIIFLDENDKNLPLHIINNSGMHHHGYYDNGIWEGMIKDKKNSMTIPDLVNFTFSQIDNEDHVEVTVEYDGRRVMISDHFYVPANYYDMMNKQLRKLFMYGLMTTYHDNIKWKKENIMNIENIHMPEWIKDVSVDKEKELFKFLLQI